MELSIFINFFYFLTFESTFLLTQFIQFFNKKFKFYGLKLSIDAFTKMEIVLASRSLEFIIFYLSFLSFSDP